MLREASSMWREGGVKKKESLTAERIAQLYTAKNQVRPASGASPNSALSISAQYVLKAVKSRAQQSLTALDTEELEALILEVESKESEFLSDRERAATIAALQRSLDHYDLLTPLIENPAVNDIIVSRFDNISVQIGRRNIQTDLRFASREAYKSFLEQLLKRAGKACTTASPVVDAAIDPHIRACVTHESFSPQGEGPFLTLRIARKEAMSFESLLSSGMAPTAVLNYLQAIARKGAATLLIAGEVGTGKTTLVRALASTLDNEEALLVIEDTHELMLERPFTRTLLTREANTEGAGKIAPAEAIRAGMRMAMNRVILGEMRDAEAAEAFIDICASGHPGMSTIHARSARDALHRLELFLLRAQPSVGVEVVRRLIANAVSVVVFLGVDPSTRRRRVQQVVEIATAADGQVQTNPIFSFSSHGEEARWIRDSGISQFSDLLQKDGVHLPRVGEYMRDEVQAER